MDIQKPRQELDGLPVCPYAKLASTNNSYSIADVTIQSVYNALDCVDTNKDLVTVLILENYQAFEIDYLLDFTKKLNDQYNKKDLIVLENDPRTPMVINNVVTTFNGNFLWLAQSMSDLIAKSKDLQKTNYYSYWTQKQLEEVVTWRT